MTPAEWAAQTRREQGFPELLENPSVLADLATDPAVLAAWGDRDGTPG